MSDAASITIKELSPGLTRRLQDRAAQHGRSVQDEARDILEAALALQSGMSGAELFAAIRECVKPFGGIELDIPVREPVRDPPTFD